VPIFFENRIFLPRETSEKTEKLVMTIRDILIEFDTAQMGNDEYKPDQTGLWVQASKHLRDERIGDVPLVYQFH
jgi:hypothetical protein